MPLHRERAVDGHTHFLKTSLAEYARSGALAVMVARRGARVPPLEAVADVAPIPAILEEDRWVAVCPDCRRNAQLVWRETPLYFCGHCLNVAVGGAWRPVAFPATAARIEEIVGHRPMPHTRNWRGETLAQLRAENRRHGVSVPGGGA